MSSKNRVIDTYECEKPLAKMTRTERIYKAHHLRIEHPLFKQLLAEIEDCHFLQLSRNCDPDCLLIWGVTGAGKSTLLDAYVQKYSRQETESGTIVPVLNAVVPAPTTVKVMVSKLLQCLGDPAFDRGTTGNQTMRLFNLLKDCQTELILLDELNHLFDRDSEKLLKTASDWLKCLILETKIPIVAFGLPTSQFVLSKENNEQLSRRFSQRFYLNPFYWSVENQDFSGSQDTDGHLFRNFLFVLDSQLPLLERSDLASQQTAKSIFYATDGIIGYVMKLVRGALQIALKQSDESITIEMLAASFDKHIKQDKPGKVNPFINDFSLKDVPDLSSEAVKLQFVATNKRLRSKNLSYARASSVLHA
jgi:Bacterial TniB protein